MSNFTYSFKKLKNWKGIWKNLVRIDFWALNEIFGLVPCFKDHYTISNITLSILGPSWYVFFFSYLLNFCRQFHLCKFLIMGDLSSHLFGIVLYMFVLHIHSHLLDNLVLHFLGENLNNFDKLCIFPEIYFILKDHQKPHDGTRNKRTLISLFSSIH